MRAHFILLSSWLLQLRRRKHQRNGRNYRNKRLSLMARASNPKAARGISSGCSGGHVGSPQHALDNDTACYTRRAIPGRILDRSNSYGRSSCRHPTQLRMVALVLQRCSVPGSSWDRSGKEGSASDCAARAGNQGVPRASKPACLTALDATHIDR